MKNLKVAEPAQTHFEGEFQVTAADGHTLDSDEQAYVDRLQGVLNALAADARRDATDGFSSAVLAARKQARATAVASLRADAEADQPAQTAKDKIDAIEAKYHEDLADSDDGAPKFEADQDSSRFPGFFTIKMTGSELLRPEEQDYIKQAREVLSYLAKEADKDLDALEPTSPKSAGHIDARQRAAERLRNDVDFVGMRWLTAQAAIDSVKRIREDYDKAIENVDRPKLEIDTRPDSRFDGDFRIDVSDTPNLEDTNRDDRVYVGLLKEILRQLAVDQEADRARGYSELIRNERQKKRKELADKLRSDAEAVSRGRLQAIAAANAASIAKGRYLRDLELTAGTLFTVSVAKDGDNLVAVGVKITLAKDLLPPSNIVSPEKQELYTAILAAETVIKTVCKRISDGADNTWCGRLFRSQQVESASRRAELLLDAYMRKLAAIAELGLQGPNTALAKVALDSLRRQFVADEGPRVKNSYVCRLGLACGGAAIIFLGFYVLIGLEFVSGHFWQAHRTFFLAGVGAAIGTWLSFSIREVEVSFDHLAVVEADLLDPVFRVLFVVALTITACLLFWTGVMNVEIGSLKTMPGDFAKAGTIALLVGLFCGLSERALATSVSGRASTFVRGISG
jgi:hypothetical protein